MMRYIVLALFSIFAVAYTQSLGLPLNTGNSGGKPVTPSCKYEFTVPDTKGACNRASSGLSNKVDSIKQDLDKTRIQYLSQNNMLQNTLAKIQGDTTSYISKVQDLTKEVAKLQNAVNNAGTGSSVSNANTQYINKLVHDTKDLLTKSLQDINNKIYNITYQFQSNAVQESKVNTAIETQINQQASQISQTQQKILNLENQLKNLQNKPNNPGPTGVPVSNNQINQLQQQYRKLESDIKYIDSMQQKQFTGLQDKTNRAMLLIANQSHEIDTVKQDTKSAVAQIQSAAQQAKDAKDTIDKFQKKYEPQIKITAAEVAGIQQNITGITNDLSKVGMDILNGKVQAMTANATLNSVSQQVNQVSSNFSNLQNTIQAQANELLRISLSLKKLSASGTGTSTGTGSSTGSGNSAALQQTLQTFQNQTQASIKKTDATVKQLQTMVSTLLGQVTTLLTQKG